MVRISRILIALFTLPAMANAQQTASAVPKWDVGLTVGWFNANPSKVTDYGDEWYSQARYGIAAGRYWTSHLKTELEFTAAPEGSRYTHRYANVPEVPSYYPISIEERYQTDQLSGRIVWQFLENVWVHPYLSGGITCELQRQSFRTVEQYFYTSGDVRNPSTRILVTPAIETGPETILRVGATAGAGVKLYLSQNSFFNTGIVTTFVTPAKTVSVFAGFGFDF